MSKCPNCGATLTCGCQKRKLADGKTGCNKCASGITKPTAPKVLGVLPNKQPTSDTKPIVNSVKINP